MRGDDVKPSEGEHRHGQASRVYPVDTPEHIRAAWPHTNHRDGAARHAAGQHGVDIRADRPDNKPGLPNEKGPTQCI